MRKLTKKSGYKCLDEIHIDLSKSYKIMLTNKGYFYFITITNTNSRTPKDLNFKLKNKLFNSIWRDYKSSFETINYLFVIEYPGAVSKNHNNITRAQIELAVLNKFEVHTHIIINTTLSQETIEYYIQNTFYKPNINIIEITNNPQRQNLINYFKKQKHISDDCYNYKITQT